MWPETWFRRHATDFIYTKDLILYFTDSVDENMATLVQLQGPGDRQTLHDLLQQSLADHLQVSVAMPLYEVFVNVPMCDIVTFAMLVSPFQASPETSGTDVEAELYNKVVGA